MAGANHRIEISVEGNNIHYKPHDCHVRREDTITWECQEPFAIQFLGVSPVETGEARSPGRSMPVTKHVGPAIQAGKYSYACAVYVENEVYLDACCPAIIVDYP